MASSPTTSPPSDPDLSSSSTPPTSKTPPSDNSSSSSAPPPDKSDSSPSTNDTSTSGPPPPSNNEDTSSSSSPSPPPPPSSSNTSSLEPPLPSSANGEDSSSGSSQSPPPPLQQQRHTPSSPPTRHTHSPNSSALSPPQTGKSDDVDGSSTMGSSENVNLPLVVGMTTGVALFLIMLVVIFLCCNRKKKRPHDHVMNYYTDPSRSGARMSKAVDYYHPGPPSWGPPMDHVAKVPPPPGWHAPPQPLPPMTTSGEMSSAYSGPHGPVLPPPSPNIALGFNKSTFSYDELAAATNGFSHANLLGQGGFGYVHKGVLPNGKEIAVKSLKSGSGQGEREFQAEVEIISRVHHRHLVSLVGYCIAANQRMLVYEFVPNNTLEFHLHGKGGQALDFPTRMKIALGSAKGLAYLHEDCHPKIIHRDIKAANILLDFTFEAMVADFGLAKLSADNYTHVSTRIMGTFGYLAPEYASSGKLTEKSDVFSFGVMLLELITGRRPVDSSMMEDSLVDWARPLLERALSDGNYDEFMDPRLGSDYESVDMARLVTCAAASVRHSARRRPKMSQIVRALEGDSSLEDLRDGMKHGTSASAMFSSSGSSEIDSASYNSQMKRFQMMAMGSEEFGSSEYGGTREYETQVNSSSSGGRKPSQAL